MMCQLTGVKTLTTCQTFDNQWMWFNNWIE